MIKILNEGKIIEYTKGDHFELHATADEAGDNTILRFIISLDETSQPVVDEQFQYNDGGFSITLTDAEKNSFDIGNYIFKMLLVDSGKVVTTLSGDFLVKWGC